jgi:hypothetical protein
VRKLFESQWDSFVSIVLVEVPPNLHPLFKRAFYGGGLVVMGIMTKIGDDDRISEEQGALILESMDKELRAFVNEARTPTTAAPEPLKVWTPGSDTQKH